VAAGVSSGEGDDPRVVPVYALTGGRTRSTSEDLALETLVSSTDEGLASLPELRFEHARIVEVCRTPVSVVEVAAALAVPLGVARVLVSDLHSVHMLAVHRAAAAGGGPPPTEILERLLAGLRGSTR
jgi:Protein of unknown function (DUF742)